MSKNDPNVLGTVEKGKIAELIKAEFDEIIDIVSREMKQTEDEIYEKAATKFGIKMMQKKITSLRKEISDIETEITKLGFNNRNGFNTIYIDGSCKVDPKTKAGKFYYDRIAISKDIQAIKCQRDNRLKTLWLTKDRQEIIQLANSKITVKLEDKRSN